MTLTETELARAVIARLLDWEDAHAGFDRVVAGLWVTGLAGGRSLLAA